MAGSPDGFFETQTPGSRHFCSQTSDPVEVKNDGNTQLTRFFFRDLFLQRDCEHDPFGGAGEFVG